MIVARAGTSRPVPFPFDPIPRLDTHRSCPEHASSPSPTLTPGMSGRFDTYRISLQRWPTHQLRDAPPPIWPRAAPGDRPPAGRVVTRPRDVLRTIRWARPAAGRAISRLGPDRPGCSPSVAGVDSIVSPAGRPPCLGADRRRPARPGLRGGRPARVGGEGARASGCHQGRPCLLFPSGDT